MDKLRLKYSYGCKKQFSKTLSTIKFPENRVGASKLLDVFYPNWMPGVCDARRRFSLTANKDILGINSQYIIIYSPRFLFYKISKIDIRLIEPLTLRIRSGQALGLQCLWCPFTLFRPGTQYLAISNDISVDVMVYVDLSDS